MTNRSKSMCLTVEEAAELLGVSRAMVGGRVPGYAGRVGFAGVPGGPAVAGAAWWA